MAKLILVGLPIGNKEDLTVRARKALEEGEIFFVEDTRAFYSFLGILEIKPEGKKVFSFHDQSSDREKEKLLENLRQGFDVYLASEAGSPVISDPAYPAIKAVLEAGFEIETLPGVSSVIVALELSGLPPHPFYFHAFLPRDEKQFSFLKFKGTHLFFESPERVLATLDRLTVAWPQLLFSVGRELTKKFQTVYRFKSQEWPTVRETVMCKGEFVVAVYSEGKDQNEISDEVTTLAEACLENPGTKNLSKLLGLLLKKENKELYSKLIQKNKE